jgi:hypothetical protein
VLVRGLRWALTRRTTHGTALLVQISSGLRVVTTYCHEDDCAREIDGARSDAEFCTNACRQRAYRRRKKALAPWAGDADAALDDPLARQKRRFAVTDSSPDSRNA